MKDFYEAVKEGKKPTNRLMYKLLSENWKKEGFTSKAHEKKFFEKGKFYLSGFLKESFDPKVIPVALEQKFTLPLPFKKGERPLKIGGIMDRVDVLKSDKLEIIDYKTGATIPTQRQVDKDLQLTFYILAATFIKEKPFDKLPEEVSASLYFLDVQEKFTTTRTKKQIEEAVNEIYKVRREIEESDFKCSGSIICEKCEFSLFCRDDG
jgi:CRISPR/Cas system-associated exonuclease Cas4 (RecB family)